MKAEQLVPDRAARSGTVQLAEARFRTRNRPDEFRAQARRPVVPGTAPITGLSPDAVTGDRFQPDDQPAPRTPALTARTRVGTQLYSPGRRVS